MRSRHLLAPLAAIAVLAVGAADASAVTRYAAPGGTAADTVCVTPAAAKCSIGTAAAGPNVVIADEAVILPGDYDMDDLAGAADSNPSDELIQPKAGSVHGEFGSPRPVISYEPTNAFSFGAFGVGAGVTLSHVEIVSTTSFSSLRVNGTTAVVEGVVVRNSASSSYACLHTFGTIRNTACLASGSNGSGVGANESTASTTATLTLRGVTARATGAGGFGLNYQWFGPAVNRTIDVRNTIADGTAFDIRASGRSLTPATPNTGAVVVVNADFSNYATEQEQADATANGAASVSNPGSDSNETAAPDLAGDGYHQLSTSTSTINQGGPLDGSSGAFDIDRQARQIGLAPSDIGADERAIATTTAVECEPSAVFTGATTTCTATVSAGAEFINGSVAFSSDSGGSFSPAASCAVSGNSPSAQCSVTFSPAQAGPHQITATYSGGANHFGSSDDTALTVNPPVATTTQLECIPSPLTLGAGSASCTATVAPGFPTATVSFTSAGGGTFSPADCTLAALTGASRCKVSYSPSRSGAHQLTASYGGETGFAPSAGTATLQVVDPPAVKKKKCKRKKKAKRASASAKKKKCKKKRKR